MVVMAAFHRYESGVLSIVSAVAMLLLGGLAVCNVASVFALWDRHRFRAFYPIVVFVAAITLCFEGMPYADQIALSGTPCSPDSFLVAQAKSDLEKAATQTLGQSFKTVYANPHEQPKMIAGHSQKAVPPDMAGALRRYGFQFTEIDDAQSLVIFRYLHLRRWYRYTYTTNKLVPLGSRPPTITEVDIEDWSELIRIAKQGDHATGEEACRIVFCPEIVYPYLRKELGQDLLERLRRGSPSGQEISTEQQRSVLNALNRQWLPAGRLVENLGITFDSTNDALHLGRYTTIGTSFWVVLLTKKLLSEGVLEYAADRSHLKVRENISPSDQNRIAWLHVGFMNWLYGNLFKKTEHLNDRSLGEGWYFRVE